MLDRENAGSFLNKAAAEPSPLGLRSRTARYVTADEHTYAGMDSAKRTIPRDVSRRPHYVAAGLAVHVTPGPPVEELSG
jgi:hypothetical protein